MSLEVPDEVVRLFRSKGYHGTSLELNVSRAHIRELWGTRSSGKGGVRLWRSRQMRAMTVIGRMRSCDSQELVVHVLREAGKHFRSNSMASWRPYVLLALGLMGEPLDALEAMDPLAVHRTWPSARPLAVRFQQRQVPAPADGEPAGAPAGQAPESQSGKTEQSDDNDSDVSSMSSSSTSSSSDMDASSHKTDSPEAAGSSSTWARLGREPPTTSGCSTSAGLSGKSSAPAGSSKLSEQGSDASEPAEMIRNILRMRHATPKRVLGLGPGARAIEVRKQYMQIARMIHPDKCHLPDATAAFQIVSKAYEESQQT